MAPEEAAPARTVIDITPELSRRRRRRIAAGALQFGAFFTIWDVWAFTSNGHLRVCEDLAFGGTLLAAALFYCSRRVALGHRAAAIAAAALGMCTIPVPILQVLGVSDDMIAEAASGLAHGSLAGAQAALHVACGAADQYGALADLRASIALALTGLGGIFIVNAAAIAAGLAAGLAVAVGPFVSAVPGLLSAIRTPEPPSAPARVEAVAGRTNRRIALAFYLAAAPVWLGSVALGMVAIPRLVQLPVTLSPQHRVLAPDIEGGGSLSMRNSSMSLLLLRFNPAKIGVGELFADALGELETVAKLLAGFAAVVWLAATITNLGRRFAATAIAEMRQVDRRKPLFLIRSFRDDMTTIARPLSWRAFLGGFQMRLTLEETVVNALWRFGPVITIGRPGDRLRPLGAAREYLGEDEWRPRVHEYLTESQALVTILGATLNLTWEYERVAEHKLAGRLMAIVPPVAPGDIAKRWANFTAAIAPAHAAALPAPALGHEVLAVSFRGGNSPVFVVSKYRDQEAYETAVAKLGV